MIELSFPDGSVSQVEKIQAKEMTLIGDPELRINPFRQAIFTSNASGQINLTGVRTLTLNETEPGGGSIQFPLVTGAAINYNGGKLSAKRAQFKVIAGSARIEDPLATSTRLLFSASGATEIINDVALFYDYEGEHYEKEYKPKASALVGLFQTSGRIEFVKIPPGIIDHTSRLARVKSVKLKLNQETREIAQPDLKPAWVSARSVLFPASFPLNLSRLNPALV